MNSSDATYLFLYPWKHQTSSSFLIFLMGYRKRPVTWNRLTTETCSNLTIKKLYLRQRSPNGVSIFNFKYFSYVALIKISCIMLLLTFVIKDRKFQQQRKGSNCEPLKYNAPFALYGSEPCPFKAWCQLKAHIYLSKSAVKSCWFV